jgi:glycosyltransferase involved in cell wall biosynthesis
MKILFFINTLAAGGKERRLIELIKGLKTKQDFHFELVVMSNDIYYKEVFDLNIKIHYLIRTSKKDFSIFKKIYKLCNDYRPDIVHCWDSMTAFYLFPVCKLLLKIKLINGMVVGCPVRQNILNPHWLRARITFPFSDCIVGNSAAGLKAYNAPKGKSMVIYNGFNFDRHKNITPSEIFRKQMDITTEYIVGMVASFSENKDYKTYYTAAEIVLKKRNDITFLAIGNETDSQKSRELIDKGADQNFRLMGKRSDIESCINAMDICVLATFTEGISNSILEYMAAGKPVIATRGGGTAELVLDNETGFLVTPSEPTELANKIEFLVNDKQLRFTFGSAGKLRVTEKFSIDQMVDGYTNLYYSLVMK